MKLLLAIFAILMNSFGVNAVNHVAELKKHREAVKEMFYHAYDGYLRHAYPYDELRPLSCDGHNTWGEYSLTLVDALDTLVVLGNYSEFRRVSDLLVKTLNFDRDINVSVFETNIRIVGGLLSAHLLQRQARAGLEVGWPCSGPLLRLAEGVARRLLPAFDTATGMPYGTVNLRHGVPKGETPITCTAGVGTFIVEFGVLSQLTGDQVFEDAAMRALEALYDCRSEIDLVGNHIDVQTGKWSALEAGIGAGIDSYFEYLVKGAALLNKPRLMDMFYKHYAAVKKYVKKEDWHLLVHMDKGQVTMPLFESLEAFWPGLLSMIGEVPEGLKSFHNYHQIWRQFGFTPEMYNIVRGEPHSGREGYPLRPEHIESMVYLYRATRDPFLIEAGVDVLTSINASTRTSCGFATVKNVADHTLADRMESFFLSETIKYLYLLFDPDNFIHNNGSTADVIQTPAGECIVNAGGFIFNTEAHPLDPAAAHCCSNKRHGWDMKLQDMADNLDLLTLTGLRDSDDVEFEEALKRKGFKNDFPSVEDLDIRDIPGLDSSVGENILDESLLWDAINLGKSKGVLRKGILLGDKLRGQLEYQLEGQEEGLVSQQHLLTCSPLPFLQRISIRGEIFRYQEPIASPPP